MIISETWKVLFLCILYNEVTKNTFYTLKTLRRIQWKYSQPIVWWQGGYALEIPVRKAGLLLSEGFIEELFLHQALKQVRDSTKFSCEAGPEADSLLRLRPFFNTRTSNILVQSCLSWKSSNATVARWVD